MAKTKDDVTLHIQVTYSIPKEERENYATPNLCAADCLRQDVEAYEAGRLSLADLIWNAYVKKRAIQVSR